MKPLELTVYPLLEKVGLLAERGYIVNRKPVTFWYVDNYQVFEKRLADAELAAEAWAAQCNRRVRNYDPTQDIPGVTWEWEHDIMARFATLPHYDEASL